jgi:NAD(P)-dependent dehydrogenase (short-subunit alcohol dehydrogenase family)
MGKLSGRTAVVTGGAKGIGKHYSQALAAEGAEVVIVDVADGESLAQELAAKFGRDIGMSVTCDVSDEAAVQRLIGQVIERFGKIDILVNNAALFAALPGQTVTEIDVATWDKVMAVNLRGPFLMVQHATPHMIARRYGKIINIGSGTVFRGIPQFLHYVTSKGGIVAFTRSLSRELGQHGICVNTLSPGFTLSESLVEENPGNVNAWREPSAQSRAIQRDQYPQDSPAHLSF